MKRNAYL